uniref:Potassium channel domain-containing protein n=1 Tax=Plectus sambesii TaxID=2011161 RepID=A0A914URC3_9BILA
MASSPARHLNFGNDSVWTSGHYSGKLLTKCLKTPWFLMKCGCRRLFRYCTKQSMSEIRRLDEEDRRDLAIFDLPIPVAIFIVIAWIFVCSATFCIWEEDWDYFVAFYFFFISLSTIGLGDITPTQPKYLLMLFGYIIIGLSLVSMCINLIQAKLERTYEAGRGGDDTPSIMSADHHSTAVQFDVQSKRADSYRGGTLGIIQRSSSFSLSSKHGSPAKKPKRRGVNRTCQTLLSFPSPTKNRRLSCTDSNGGK